MSDQKPELWARADQLSDWAKQLRDMQDRIHGLLESLNDMNCFQVTQFKGSDLLVDAEDPAAPPPLTARKLLSAARYYAENSAMPPWMPVCTKADAERVVAKAAACAPAPAADPKMTERVAALEAEDSEAKAVAPKTKAWPAPPPESPEQKSRKLQKGLKRISFRMKLDQISKEHGIEVGHYAVKNLCGATRTANALTKAMVNFLGVFPTKAHAGAAFARANKKQFLGEGAAEEALELARHKVELESGHLAVWSHHVAPGDMGDADVDAGAA